MVHKVVLSPNAQVSILAIRNYIADDNPKVAQKFVNDLRRSTKSLARMPGRCPIAPECEKNEKTYRHLLHGNYRVIFLIEGNEVYIVDVHHAARLPLEIGT